MIHALNIWADMYNKVDKEKFNLMLENAKLKQTLAKIKEIAKNGCYDDCGMPLDELSIILEIISEVENANI